MTAQPLTNPGKTGILSNPTRFESIIRARHSRSLPQVKILSATSSLVPTSTAQAATSLMAQNTTANDMSRELGFEVRDWLDTITQRCYSKLISTLTPEQATRYETFYKFWWVAFLLSIGLLVIAFGSSYVIVEIYKIFGFIPDELERLRLAREAGIRYDPITRDGSRIERRTALQRLQAMLRSIHIAWGCMFALTAICYLVATYKYSVPDFERTYIENFNEHYVHHLFLIIAIFFAAPTLVVLVLRTWLLPSAQCSESWLCPRPRFREKFDLGDDTTDGEDYGDLMSGANGHPLKHTSVTTGPRLSCRTGGTVGDRRARRELRQRQEYSYEVDFPRDKTTAIISSTQPPAQAQTSQPASTRQTERDLRPLDVGRPTQQRSSRWDLPPQRPPPGPLRPTTNSGYHHEAVGAPDLEETPVRPRTRRQATPGHGIVGPVRASARLRERSARDSVGNGGIEED